MPWDFKLVDIDSHDYLPTLRAFLSLQFLAEMVEMFPHELIDES